jgi:cation diffusion facilitator family transporter
VATGRKLVIYAALVGNLLIAITKFMAAGITGSSAMLSEGIHSLVDTGNQVLLLYGLKRATRPPDERFPFGHGKEVYFWSFVVSILIFAVGAGISIYEGVHRVLEPTPVRNPTVNYVVLGLAIVFEGVAWTMALREFQRAKGALPCSWCCSRIPRRCSGCWSRWRASRWRSSPARCGSTAPPPSSSG